MSNPAAHIDCYIEGANNALFLTSGQYKSFPVDVAQQLDAFGFGLVMYEEPRRIEEKREFKLVITDESWEVWRFAWPEDRPLLFLGGFTADPWYWPFCVEEKRRKKLVDYLIFESPWLGHQLDALPGAVDWFGETFAGPHNRPPGRPRRFPQ